MLHPNVLITALCVPMEKKKAVDDPTHRMGLPVNLIGGSGVGKSEFVEGVGAMLRFFTHVVVPIASNPEDIGGWPVQDGKGGLTRVCDDPGIITLREVKEGILFLDEVNTNRVQMQAAYLRVVLDRVYGGAPLPPKVRVVSAMNPPALSAGGVQLTPPMANRFCHINFSPPSPREWSDWLNDFDDDNGVNIYEAEKVVIENWGPHWAVASGQVSGFIRAKSDALNNQPEPGDPRGSGAWPSCRTNFWAARALATARTLRSHLNTDAGVEDILLQGLNGEAWVTEFRKYLASAELPDPEQVLRGSWKVDKLRIDITLTVLETLGNYVVGIPEKDPTRIQKAVKAWEILGEACESGLADLCYRPATALAKAKLGAMSGDVHIAKAAKPTMERFYPKNDLFKKALGK